MHVVDRLSRSRGLEHRDDGGDDQRRFESFPYENQRRIKEGIGAALDRLAAEHFERLDQTGIELRIKIADARAISAAANGAAKFSELRLQLLSHGRVLREQRRLGELEAV